MSHETPKEDGKFFVRPELDAELQSELDAALGDMSLEDLLDQEAQEAKDKDAAEGKPAKGAGVRRGVVIDIQGDDIFVDLGGKSQGLLPAIQYEDEPLPAVGDAVEVTVEGYDAREGMLRLSRKGAVTAAAWEDLEEGALVEGRVTGINKGGLELDLHGVRAFMPISQIELFRVEELDGYLNQRLRCRVQDIDRSSQNVIVSRRAFLEYEREVKGEELWNSLEVGQVVPGVVRSIMPYGAFVDIGGVDGLLHIGDMSHSRLNDPREMVNEGDKVDVKILKIDRDERKLSLGLKQTKPDPWQTALNTHREGDIVVGRITRLADFGAFFEIVPGVEGLIPISEMSYGKRINHPREVVAEGDSVKAKIIRIEGDRKRISLSLKQMENDPWMGASVRWPENSIVEGRVTRVVDFGAFVELTAGVEGLVHVSELSNEFIRRSGDAVSVGDLVSAKVLNVDEATRRISLSIKQAQEVEATQMPEMPVERPAESPEPKRKRPRKGGLE